MKRFMLVAMIVLMGLSSVALAQDRERILVVRDDDGAKEARGHISGPTYACMKVLNLELDPAAVTQARIMFFMYNDPYDVATKACYSAPVEGVKWSNFVVTLNGHEVLRDSLIKYGTMGWHEIPVDHALLIRGANKITMTLDAPGSYAYLGIDQSASHGRSGSSTDGGKTFRTDWLAVGGAQADPGEYMVRLKLNLAGAAVAQAPERVSVVSDDDGVAEGRGQVEGPPKVCLKVLNLELDPATVTQARIMYSMAVDPYDVASKTCYSAPAEGVKWSNFVVTLNGHEVVRDSLIKYGPRGWHEIPVDPTLLIRGNNRITMALDGGGGYFYLSADRTASRGRSASSLDGGKTFRTNYLNFGDEVPTGEAGEYMVRLKLWTSSAPADVGFTEQKGRYYGWLEVEDLFSATRPHVSGFKAIPWQQGINKPSRDQVAYGLAGSFEFPLDLPADGEWRLWLRGWMDGFRNGAFSLSWDGKPLYSSEGKHEFTSDAQLRFDWLDAGSAQMTKGRHILGVTTTGDCGHMLDVLVLTTDPAYRPDVGKPLARMTRIEKLVPPEGVAYLQPGLYMTENPIPWAKPMAGGPLRTLWVCGGINEREIVELQQRMDMTADVVSSDVDTYYSNGVFGSNLNLDQGDLIYDLLASDRSYDVAVLVRVKLDQIPEHAMAELLRRAQEGMGIIVVNSQRAEEGETKLSALFKEVKPFNLPAFKAPFDLRGQAGLSWREYGKGRIILRTYANYGTVDHVALSADERRVLPFWEYQFGQWVKLLEWAGRRDAARVASVAIPETLPPGQQAELTITTEGAEGTQVAGVVWAPNQAGWMKWGPVPCVGGATVKLPAGTEDGLYHVEASLLNARGEVLDSAATFYRVDQPARLAEMKAEYAAEGGGQAVVTLKTANAGAATKLPARLEVWGARERMLGAKDLTIEFASGAGETKVSVPVMPSWERLLEARLTIPGGGDVPRQRMNQLFHRPQKVVLDDYTSVTGHHENMEAPTYTWPAYCRLDDDMGMKADYPGIMHWSSLDTGIATASIFRMTSVGTPVTTPGGARVPCLHDPAVWAKEEPAIRDLARYFDSFSPLVLGLGDEMAISHFHEVCFSKYTLAAFRESLQKQYGTIQKLNATWQTQFADWDAIIPWQIPQARQRPENIAPWLEFRVFMTRTLVESLVKMQKWVKEGAPGSYTGGANPLDESYTSCAIFSELYPALEYAQVYPRFHDRARSWFRDPRLVGMWSGYGYDRATTEYHAWLLPAYSGTLMCWFGAGRSYDYRTLTNTLNMGEPGRSIQGANRELESGIGKLLIAADVEQEPVAILSSYRSKYAYTALKASKAPQYNPTGYDQEFDEFLSGYSALLRKVRVPYRYINEEQLEQGILDRYSLVIAPQASVLSEGAVQKLSAFARQHPVIADQSLGTYDEHGCKRAAAPFNFAQPGGLKLNDFGDQPLRSTNENLARLRQVVAAAGIQPCPEVAGGDIDFIVRKRLGDVSLLMVFGRGALVVKAPAGTVAYDARAHKLLGTGTTILTQERSPAVVVFAPQKVAGVTLTATPPVQRGQQVTFDVQVQPGVMTVVRLTATGPDGKPRPWYDVNVAIKEGKGSATFRPALNDAVGEWRFVATDIVSGITAEAKVLVKE